MHGRRSAAALLFALSLLLLSAAANAATITVTSTADTVVSDDGQCTLREAIIAANTNSPSGPAAGECIAGNFGADAIIFAIPGAGVQTITLTADLPQITELLTIDGYSQPGASANTLATGDNATLLIAINGGLFTVFNIAANSTIRGIDFTTYGTAIFQNVAGVNQTRIIGNFFGTNATGTAVTIPNDTSAIALANSTAFIGTTLPADRNIFAGVGTSPGILLNFANATIRGNYFGVDSSGGTPLGIGEGVLFQLGAGGSVGSTIAGAGNVFGNWNVAAIEFRGVTTSGTILVQGNLIGTNATGTGRLATGGFGILANGATRDVQIGGSTAPEGNVISGALNGIELDDVADTWFIGHNKIGTDISGLVPIPNTNSGICATQTGSGTISNNTIAFNGTQGVDLGGSVTFYLSTNSIFANGGLGISLQGLCDAVAAPLANDTCDADAGANGLQNFPIITAASISAGNVTISGTINSNPGTSLRIEFFSNAVCDPSGNGEGQTFLGVTSVLTARSCDATFGPVTFAIPSGQTFITATASTNAIPGATSEFSSCFAAAGAATTDVAITKTDAPDPVNAGSDLTYTITVTNNGPSDASSVSLTDALPANTTFVSFAAPAGWTSSTPPAGGTGTVTATNPLLAASATATFTLVVHVDPATAAASTISNTATVTTTTTDTNPGNNSTTATTTVAASADVSVAKTDAPDPVTAGNNITYTITVANAGPSNAASVSLTDGVPANTTFVSVTAPAGWTVTAPPAGGTGTITATNPSLATGTSATFTLVVNVNGGTGSGTTITNTATVASATPDPNAANNSATATTQVSALQADLSVAKSGTPSIVTPGSTITYTITVANSGPAAAASVTLSDAIPANTTFVSATAPAGWTLTTPAAGGTGTVTATNPSLAATSTATFTLVVRTASGVPNGTTISNTATATSTTSDPNAANNSATATTTVNVATAIPALGPLGLLLLMATLALAGVILARRT